MESDKTGSRRCFNSLAYVFVLILLTVAASFIIHHTARYNQSDPQPSSYSMQFEMRNDNNKIGSYNIAHGCIFSEGGFPCALKNSHISVSPLLFSFINLSADLEPGNYRGIRVQLHGRKGDVFHLRSIILQSKTIFDGKDFSLFKNIRGLDIFRNPETRLVIFRLTSDSASFNLDTSFTVKSDNSSAVKYAGSVISAVLAIAAVMLLSALGRSGAASDPSSGKSFNDERTGGSIPGSSKVFWRHLALFSSLFALLFFILSTCLDMFAYNKISIVQEGSKPGRSIEVSDSPEFSYTAGRGSFYNVINNHTWIRIPVRYSNIRITRLTDGTEDRGFSLVSPSGKCELKNQTLVTAGGLSCMADRQGRLQANFDGTDRVVMGVVYRALAALTAAVVICLSFRFLRFCTAVRLMLWIIMLSAYVTGEICMNIKLNNFLFYQSYMHLIPDTVLKNICLILCLFLLAEMAFIRGRICPVVSLLLLLLTISYVALDWGVSWNFGARADFRTVFSHTGADVPTALVFAGAFFRHSDASWMVFAMFAAWIIMALSFRHREDCPLRKYLILVLILNCIPFLKVYENFYTENSSRLRKDIFDIQREFSRKEDSYTYNFPEYDWKPEYQIIDGLNRRKNVVILMVESLSVAYSNYFSGLKGYTPNIDMLAEKNASFLNYHSTGMETSPATYSVMTGKIFFSDLDRDSADLHFEYDEALPRVMRSEGYTTSAIYSSEDFGGLDEIYRNSGFEHFYDSHDPAYNGVRRYLFNSVADGVLLEHAAGLIKKFDSEAKPHMTFIMTASSHTPFISPETGKQGYRELIAYVDREIGKFVSHLEGNGFFDNGTLIITGDHCPPGLDFAPGELDKYGDDLNRVPLIIIDRDIGKVKFDNVFGHDSLKTLVEYLNLSRVKKYEYQLLPLWENDKDRGVTVLCPILLQNNYLGGIRVSGPKGEQGIYDARGDSSRFISRFLSPEEEKEVAGRVKWFKREE